MTEKPQTVSETPVAETPEVSRRRKIVAASASIGTTVVLTVLTNVAIGLASQKVTDLIMNDTKKA
jgi:hypothetical protein